MMDKHRLAGLMLAGLGMAMASGTAAAEAPQPPQPSQPPAREQLIAIPAKDAEGQPISLQGRVCRPVGDAPARLVVINHGSPASAAARPTMKIGSCDQEAARWFLERGYVVVFAVRRGYGATGGNWVEAYGRCDDPDYARAGRATADDIDAIVNYATTLPYVRPAGAIVVGQSAGGWGTVAYSSRPHPKVAAMVNMAGGRGGHRGGQPHSNCTPERLVTAAAGYGASAATPMLWVYTANDSYFSPDLALRMHAAFAHAGGKAELAQLGAYGEDGHRLFFGPGGSQIWGPIVERYLARQLAD